MILVDSHAHLTAPSAYDHVDEILERAEQKKLKAIVNICTDPASLDKGIQLSGRHPWIFNAAATTPHDVEKEGELFFPAVEEKAREGKLIAIGETGLDYHYHHSLISAQKAYLIRYFALALAAKLPVIFHCREAFKDLFELADHHYQGRPAVLHCFTGTLEEAKGCLERGWMISISGIITFKKSTLLKEVAAYVPLDRLLIETDTPYLAPESKRGKSNEPSYIEETVKVLAQVKGISLEEMAEATARNAFQFFSFPKHLLSV
ncbi:MAG TPA: TatD family hydrolase [Rhabdochlamydiaceae bacterium]|jgi:TatD DNase family protein|nr:TatD family hydrolase [Rhabdochlamydiaceae bacterium]